MPTAEELVEFIRAKADNPSYVDKAVPVKPKVSKQHKQGGSVNIVTPQPAPQPVHQPPPPPYQAPQSAPVQSAPQPHRGRGGQQRQRQVQPTCRYVCLLCSETHYAFSCAQFESYSVAQRKEHASMHNLCTNCLKPGHSASNCRSEYHCRLCQGRHSTLLHVDTTAPQAQPAQGTVNLVNTPASPQQTGTLIMTCQVLMTGPTGKTMIARALLDTGATLSLISTKAMKSLGLTKQGTSVFIKGVDSVKNSPARPIVSVRVSSLCRKDWSQQVNVAVPPEVTPDLPLQGASSIRDLPHIQGLQLADPHFDQPGRVDLLLGEDSMSDILLPAQETGPPGTAKAWNTVFGWALRGAFTPDKPRGTSPAPVYVATCSAVETTQDALVKFWELEEPPKPAVIMTPEEKEVQSQYDLTHSYVEHAGKYMVSLPRKEGNLRLGESRNQALSRYKANERSLLNKALWTSSKLLSRSIWTWAMPDW